MYYPGKLYGYCITRVLRAVKYPYPGTRGMNLFSSLSLNPDFIINLKFRVNLMCCTPGTWYLNWYLKA